MMSDGGPPPPPPPGAGGGGLSAGPRGSMPESDAPTLFAAVQQQLGLKLDAKKGMVDILVVDHIEKVPTEN
jgi:uncharacterized protein (TIGR03435 family)